LNPDKGNPIVKWSKGFNGSMGAAALLLPLMVAAESHIQTQAASAASAATAHVNFKIIIPTVLYLRAGGGRDRIAGAETVAVMSNSRNVTLSATVRTLDSDHPRGSVILGASARKVIAQDAPCREFMPLSGDAHTVSAPAEGRGRIKVDDRHVICTVSMP
jgi:hypothetical protein